jgi:hypothetical protein
MTPDEIAAPRAEEVAARMVLPAAVKVECQRRIYSRYPQWKQNNLTARDGELVRIQQGSMIDDAGNALPARALTDAGKAEQVAHKSAWGWIKATRVASDALEAMDPIPADLAADGYWPADSGSYFFPPRHTVDVDVLIHYPVAVIVEQA